MLVIILIEDKRSPICSIDLKSKFPRSSTVYVTKKNYDVCINLIKGSPTLTKSWLVFIDVRVPVEHLKQILKVSKHNVNIVNSTHHDCKEKYGFCKSIGLHPQILDCIKPSDQECIGHITKSLKCSNEVALYLTRSCNNYMPHIEECILLLTGYNGVLDNRIVDLYVPKRSSITVHTLFYHILGEKTVDMSQLALFLYNFRYGIKYVLQSLNDMFSDTIEIYKLMNAGELGEDNYEDYSYKDIKLTKYMISVIVTSIYHKVDFDTIVRYKLVLSNIKDVPNLLNIL